MPTRKSKYESMAPGFYCEASSEREGSVSLRNKYDPGVVYETVPDDTIGREYLIRRSWAVFEAQLAQGHEEGRHLEFPNRHCVACLESGRFL